MQTSAAEAFARRAHAGQVDKAGRPYVEHLARVAAILVRTFPDASPSEIEAAWLHDVLEDTNARPIDLLREGISDAAIDIVQELTKPKGIRYLDWIRELAERGSQSAIRVKLADNEDNRDPMRVAAVPDGARLVAERYGPARAILLQALRPA